VGLRLAAPEGDPSTARLPFSVDQLRLIFGPAFAVLEGARRWVPLVSLFTGLRLNEAFQLAVDDVEVRVTDGVDAPRRHQRAKVRCRRTAAREGVHARGY